MNFAQQIREIGKQQFSQQATRVYIAAFFTIIAILPLFIVIGNNFMTIFAVVSLLASGTSYFLNQKGRYGLASFVFIFTITAQTAAQVLVFRLGGGFGYYFFSMAILIIFSSWKSIYKTIGVGIEILTLVFAFSYVLSQGEPTVLEPWQLVTFTFINSILNMIGVANSANYFLILGQKAQTNLIEMARTDYLTGIANRNAFSEYVEKMKSQQGLCPCGIIMIDIDHFKSVNDHYGHVGGDEVLKQVANLLITECKSRDFIARMGGEEFIFIQVAKDEQDFIDFAERLRQKFKSHNFIFNDIVIQLTISLGAVFRSCSATLDCHMLISTADDLLYQAKEKGRDRVEFKAV